MNQTLRLFLIICCLMFLTVVIHMLRKKRLDVKHMLIWFFSVLSVLTLALFPHILISIARLIGIIEPVNALFLFAMLYVILILFSIAVTIFRMSERIKKLIQYIAILEKRIRDNEEKL